jgi:hypothetical protein
VVADGGHATLARAIGAAIERISRLDAVSDDLAAAMIADGCELMDRTLKTVERVSLTGGNHVKRQMIIVTANFTGTHFNLLVDANSFQTTNTAALSSATSMPEGQFKDRNFGQ